MRAIRPDDLHMLGNAGERTALPLSLAAPGAELILEPRAILAAICVIVAVEIVDLAAAPPQRDTIEWYRLACFLPAGLPASANIAEGQAERVAAARDYAYVMTQMGSCQRNRR